MKSRKLFLVLIPLILLGLYLVAAEHQVTRAPQNMQTLKARWDWAVTNATATGKGCYIGYSFQRLMGEHSYIGFHSDGSDELRTLQEILSGKPIPRKDKSKVLAQVVREMLERKEKEGKSEKKVLKDVALLFRFDATHKAPFEVEKLLACNLDSPVKLKAGPIFWLGSIEKKESLDFLENYFKRTQADQGRKQVLAAIGMHGPVPGVETFFKEIIYGSWKDNLREEAAFWLGNLGSAQGVAILLDVAENDKSEAVRKKAVFGIYLGELEQADNALIQLAKKGKHREVRKNAIFWLGQKAVKQSARILGGIAQDDPDTGLQEQAVFALSQLHNNEGVPQLIKIAKNHRYLKVRKKAIFWLGQSEDPRALETIVDIINTGKK